VHVVLYHKYTLYLPTVNVPALFAMSLTLRLYPFVIPALMTTGAVAFKIETFTVKVLPGWKTFGAKIR
jgi:hypothetical protein